ncbi:MAG TPA: C4-type zinc ribbon domain-containing protein [Thermoanaerobaculia bacterium]|jgi:predicted  nucleic acid-binding Zn-ribbon protein|nr:C4-type zinc ribbon domain-containing protein [Thermoanaerobaculia bacterium]
MSALNEREKQMSVKPEAFAAVDREYQAANDEMTRLQTQIDTLGKERRSVDGELSDQQEVLKKYQGTLMQVKNQQQYAAAWKEIDAARKHVKELEESVLKNMTESDGLQQQLDDRRGAHDALQSRYDGAHEAWQSSLGDLRAEAEKLRAKAAKIEATIPPRLLAEFRKIYKQRQQIAIARVNGDTCGSCRNRVRPQVAQQLKRGEMVHCEGCHRILYLGSPSS